MRHADGCLNFKNASVGRRRGKDLLEWLWVMCVCMCMAAIWKTQIKARKQHFVFCHEQRANTNSLFFLKPQITFWHSSPGVVLQLGPSRTSGPTSPPHCGPHCWSFAPFKQTLRNSATLAQSKFHFQCELVSSSPAVPPVMKKLMVSLSQTLNPKLLLMLSAYECSIHQETWSGGACLLVSVYKFMRRGFSRRDRLLPPPLNPLSVGDRKIRNDQTQNWFLISFQSPGCVGRPFYPVDVLSALYKDILGSPKTSVLSCALELDFLRAKEGYLHDQRKKKKPCWW